MLNFQNKPIIAMLHLKGNSSDEVFDRMRREASIYYGAGVDAVMVENYFGSVSDCERALRYLSEQYPDRVYGVDILGDWRKSFALAREYGASFVQIDSVCGHLEPIADAEFQAELLKASEGRHFQILGGLRFKYQPVRSGRTLAVDAAIAKLRCDAVVTTGDGTGMDSPLEKLATVKANLHGFPLIVGAGVTAENVAEKLRYADGAIIGTYMKDDHTAYGDVNEHYVKKLMKAVKAAREGDTFEGATLELLKVQQHVKTMTTADLVLLRHAVEEELERRV